MPDPWLDLCYHVLAHLPLPSRDHSCLYSAAYVAWYQKAHARLAPSATPRTLPEDAPLIASLYSACPQALRLQSMVLLHPTIEGFRDSAALPFHALPTSSPLHRALSQLPEALIELFRVALFTELESGFLTVHHNTVAPLHTRAKQGLEALLDEGARVVPELRNAQWRFCHPLLHSGRLFRRSSAPDLIHVGLPDPELDVPDWAPVLQGCHECLVARAQRRLQHHRAPLSTRPGSEGYDHFLAPELEALSTGAQRLGLTRGPWQAPYRRWLSRLFPDGAAQVYRMLPWREDVPAPEAHTDLVSWLAMIPT